MASRLLFVICCLWSAHSFATGGSIGHCPLETAAENGKSERLPRDSHNFGEAPFPIHEISGNMDVSHIDRLRKTLEKVGLDLEPGKEYLQDSDNCLKAVDTWAKDLDEAMKDPGRRAELERFVLFYLQHPPTQGAERDLKYHPGLAANDTLPYKRSWEEYKTDPDTFRWIDAMVNTFDNMRQFREVLAADTYQDPARRSRYITQIRVAYLMRTVLREHWPEQRRNYLPE